MEKKIKYWKYFIYFICILLVLVPYSETFTNEYEEITGSWIKNYVLDSIDIAIFVIPIIILFLSIPRIKNGLLKKIFIVILVLISGLSSLFAFLTLIMPIQDFVPDLGMLILTILFPVVIIDSLIEWRLRKTLK